MPEGDTVWLAGRRLHDALSGHVLTRSDFRIPRLATADLTGGTVTEVLSRGKHLLFRIDCGDEEPLTLHTHFRMDGSWHLYRHGTSWRGGPEWQVRVLLETARWQAVGYRLPVVELMRRDREDDAVGHLGPDLLGPDWDPTEALRRLTADRVRQVGPALLDQRNLAGIGNLYANELCYLAGVTPWTAVADVPDPARLVDRAQRLFTANAKRTAQVTTGDPRRGREHWVYARSGRPCRRCSTRIVAGETGDPPYARPAYWCPACQLGPTPNARPHPR